MSGLEGLLLEPLLGAATGASKGLYKLIKKFRNAPKEFQELVEEIQQLRVVIHSIQNANIQQVALPEMSTMVLDAKEKLLDIERAVAFRLAKPEDNEQIDRLHWARRSEEAKNLLEDLRKLTSKLTALLGVANLSSQSRLMDHMEQQHAASETITMEVRQLAQVTFSRDNQNHNVLATLENQNQVLSAMFARIEQSASTQERLEQHFGQFRLEQRPLTTAPFSSELAVNKSSGRKSLTAPSRGETLQYTAIRNSGNECPKGCRCACHKPMRLQTPMATRKWTGAMQIQCSNFSWFRNNCNIRICKRSALTSVTVQYTLPVWVAGKMVAAFYKSAPLSGPELLFKVARVHDSDVFYYAERGDLKSIQALYSSGEASIHDISSVTGNSALMAAVTSSSYDVIAFLVEWGANIEYQDPTGISVSTAMLSGLIHSRKQGFGHHPFEAIADMDDLVDNAGFTSIHNIVCGLTIGDLQNELENHPGLIDKQDNQGWTPLFWAVHLDDINMINILLEHKADVSHVDTAGQNVLHRCGNAIHTLQFVLESLSASGTNTRQLANQHNKYGNAPWHLVKTGGALSLHIQHGCDLSLLTEQSWTVLHLAMMDDRDASFAEALMVPDVEAEMKAIDLETRDILGNNAYDYYEIYYPTRRAKRTREGRAKLALLKYVESLRDGGGGSRIREVEKGDEEESSDSDYDSDYDSEDEEEDEDDEDDDEEGGGEQDDDDSHEDSHDEDEDGQDGVSMESVHASGHGQERHAAGDGERSERELSDDESEAFEDALDRLELFDVA